MREENNLKLSEKNTGLNFWLCAGLLTILLTTSLSRDIFRPFYGMHSWAEAHSAWAARVHVKYGLGYTKGFSVRAVGENLEEEPYRYLDHPQLGSLVNAAAMKILGISVWALRVANITATLITLLLFLKILRGLLDDKTALLAGLFFTFFPVIGHFGVNMWLYPLALWAIWNYLVLIRAFKNPPEPKTTHRVLLAICLFLGLQLNWEGFFFALGIGVHYVLSLLFKKRKLDWRLLLILFFAPVISIMVDFLIMAAGHGWDASNIVELFNWRAGSGEMQSHIWSDWFAKFWEFAVDDFTMPLLIVAILYLTFGQLFVFMETEPDKNRKYRPRQFPQFLIFFLPPVFQLFILKGCLWKHQTWIRPFSFLIAIAAALGIMLLAGALKKINKRLSIAVTALLLGIIFIYSVTGTNYYFNIRWQVPRKIEMFERLKQKIPPDKALLSFEDFVVNQHKAKGAFYRPEVAWHLDRDVVKATSFDQIQRYARTGKYPYYLIPYVPQADQLRQLLSQLQQKYNFEYIQGQSGEGKKGKFYRAGMLDYAIFDLRSTK